VELTEVRVRGAGLAVRLPAPAVCTRAQLGRAGLVTWKGPWPTWLNAASPQLTTLIKTRLRRMQYRPGLLAGFLASTGLDLTPFCTPAI